MTSLIYKQHNYKKSAHHKKNLLVHHDADDETDETSTREDEATEGAEGFDLPAFYVPF